MHRTSLILAVLVITLRDFLFILGDDFDACLLIVQGLITMIDQRNFCFFWAFSEIFCQFLSLMRVACSVCEKSWLMLEWHFTCHSC